MKGQTAVEARKQSQRVTPLVRGIPERAAVRPLADHAAPLDARHGTRAPAPGRDFSRVPVCTAGPTMIQPKLTIGLPGDKYEQEADRVAEQVMRMPEPRVARQPRPTCDEEETLQAKPLAGQITPVVQRQVEPEEEEEEETIQPKPAAAPITPLLQRQVEPEEEEEEEEPLQAKQAGGKTPPISPGLQAQIASLRGGGQSLPESVRSFFEPRFEYEFSLVRMHTDGRAADLACALNAHAFTLGKDIVFGGGQYSPDTVNGRRLLAHELTHVVQQTSSPFSRTPTMQRQAASNDTTADAATEVAKPALIVEDEVAELEPGQMKKSDFLAQLRTAVCRTAEEALAGTGRTTDDCPYLKFWFGYYSLKSSRHIERAIGRYAPETAGVTSAKEYIPLIAARVRRSVETWAKTGEITGVPEGISMESPASAPAESGRGAASPTGGVAFKGRNGGPRRVSNPQEVQAQLGSGRSLDIGVRSRMESVFGASFPDVRVHQDTKAAELAGRFNARAFTVGEDIAFGVGEYKPGTLVGDAIIAHELAHVVQQQNASSSSVPTQKGETEYGSLEEDADLSAVRAVFSLWSGAKAKLADIVQDAMPRLRSGLRLQRCGSERCPPGEMYYAKAGLGIGNLGPGLCRWECWPRPKDMPIYSVPSIGKAPPHSIFDREPQKTTTGTFYNANTGSCYCYPPKDKETGEPLASSQLIDCNAIGGIGGLRKSGRVKGTPKRARTVRTPHMSPKQIKQAPVKAPTKKPVGKQRLPTEPAPTTPPSSKSPVVTDPNGRITNSKNGRELILEDGLYKYKTNRQGTGKGGVCRECNPQYHELKGSRWHRRSGVKLPSEVKKGKKTSFDTIKDKKPVPVDPKVPATQLGLDKSQLSKFGKYLDSSAAVKRVAQKNTLDGIKGQLAEEVVNTIGTREVASIKPKAQGATVKFFRGDEVTAPAPKQRSKGAEHAPITDGIIAEIYQQGGKEKLHIHRIYEVKSGGPSGKGLAKQVEWDIERIKEVGISVKVPKPDGGSTWQKFVPSDITMKPRARQAEVIQGFVPSDVTPSPSESPTQKFTPKRLPGIAETDLTEAALMILRKKQGGQ